jgi:hypothetical protein
LLDPGLGLRNKYIVAQTYIVKSGRALSFIAHFMYAHSFLM